jgi:hypothetical protein
MDYHGVKEENPPEIGCSKNSKGQVTYNISYHIQMPNLKQGC